MTLPGAMSMVCRFPEKDTRRGQARKNRNTTEETIMSFSLSAQDAHEFAITELNLLNAARALPDVDLEKSELMPGTPIFDLNGEILFYRVPLEQADGQRGYVDIAAQSLFGESILALAPAADWNASTWLAQAKSVFARRARAARIADYDELRFVAYSYPKIAVQFLLDGKEVALLELATWAAIPTAEKRRKGGEPGQFERWSLIAELPGKSKADAGKRFELRAAGLRKALGQRVGAGDLFISRDFLPATIAISRLHDSQQLRYSNRAGDHAPCFELRGQETSVWCVGASVQMLLDFYRYNYEQTRLAEELGLGTLADPNGLPYGDENKVPQTLEKLTSSALSAAMVATPTFSLHVNEIRANRPLISFIPGHSRAVAGYTRSLFALAGSPGFSGLLVYDPWPPNAGVITRWENFNTQTYRYAFTAHVNTV